MAKTAILYRMALDTHICPWGLKARHILHANGYEVDDRLLITREEVDAFKADQGVMTTPQIWIGG
jgi:glutaredoxin